MNRIKAIIVIITLLSGSLGVAVTGSNSRNAKGLADKVVETASMERALTADALPSATAVPTVTPTPTVPPFYISSEYALAAYEHAPEESETIELAFDDIEIPEIVLGDINDKENVSHTIADGREVSIADMLKRVTPIPTKAPVVENKDGEDTEPQPVMYMKAGIDVSAANGDIDWEQVAASGIKFAMVRVGYRGYETGKLVADPNCYKNLAGATAAGIAVGVYFFSQALTEQEAAQEAALTCEIIKDYNITYPVAFDFEEWHYRTMYRIYKINQGQANRNARAFMDYVKSRGYTPALYSGKWDLRAFWSPELFADCVIWLAYYAADLEDDYEGRHTLWQYTGRGRVPGISTFVDMNLEYCYSYPSDGEGEDSDDTVIALPEGFTEVDELVQINIESDETDVTEIYKTPSDGDNAVVSGEISNGTVVRRTALDEVDEWSRIEVDGKSVFIKNIYLIPYDGDEIPEPSITPGEGETEEPTEGDTVTPTEQEEPDVSETPGAPEVTEDVTPSIEPEVTEIPEPEITPGVTPEITPGVTPDISEPSEPSVTGEAGAE